MPNPYPKEGDKQDLAPKKRKLYLRDPLYSITRQIWIGNKGPSQLHSSQHDVSNTFQENDNVTGNDNDDSSLSNSSSSDDDLSLNEEDVISDVSSANCSCIDDNLNSSLDEDDTDDGDASQKSNEFSICSSAATAVSSNLDGPLYPGAPITCKESWRSIYKFSVCNRLTESATQKLIDLITSHCLKPNDCVQTVYKLKNLVGSMPECIHSQYCSNCKIIVPNTEKECSVCIDKGSQMSFYSILPFEEQLKEVFVENWDKVQYPLLIPKILGVLNDIQDGKRYEKLSGPGGFFSVAEYTGLILCTDGVPLFKSSGQSLWPIQLCVTNLPPDIRMDLRYLLLAGVWLGPVKPDMSIVLKLILERIHVLYQEGMPILTPACQKCLRAKLLCVVFDLPARAMALNLIQWNSRYGCTHYVDEGSQKSHVRVYLPSDEHIVRSDTDYARTASSSGAPVFGVKGLSVLSPYLNIVKDTAIDYMHAVLEGVAKEMLVKFWLNGRYKDYRFYQKRLKQSLHYIDLFYFKPT